MEWLQASHIYFQAIWRSKQIMFPSEAWLGIVWLAGLSQNEEDDCQEKKSQTASKEGGLMKCLGQRWGAFWGDCKEKGRWGDHVWNLQESTMMGDARHAGTFPELSQEQGTRPETTHKEIQLLIWIFPLVRGFIGISWGWLPVHLAPTLPKSAVILSAFAKDQQSPVFNYSCLRE